MKKAKHLICPICGEKMNLYLFDYNTNRDERLDYKCDNCGHKETILIK